MTNYNQRGFKNKIWELSKVVDRETGDPEAYFKRAEFLLKAGKPELAIEDFNKCIELGLEGEKSRLVGFYCKRGSCFLLLQAVDKALSDFSDAIGIDPSCILAYHSRGVVFHYLQDFTRAADNFSKVIKMKPFLNPEDSHFLTTRANCYFNLNEFDKAQQDFEKAIKLNSKDCLAYKGRLDIWRMTKQPIRTIKDFFQIMRISFSEVSVNIICEVAKCFAELGESDTADRWFRVAIRRFPEYVPTFILHCQEAAIEADKNLLPLLLERSIETIAYRKVLLEEDSNVSALEDIFHPCYKQHNQQLKSVLKNMSNFKNSESKFLDIYKKIDKKYEKYLDKLHKLIRYRYMDKNKKVRELTPQYLLFRPTCETEMEHLKKMEISLNKHVGGELPMKKFEDLEIHRYLGTGCFGSAYECRVRGIIGVFVAKFLFPAIAYGNLKSELVQIPYHPNCASVYTKGADGNTFQYVNFKSMMKKKIEVHDNFKKHRSFKIKDGILQVPMILMRYYRIDLARFIRERKRLSLVPTNFEISWILCGLLEGAKHLHDHGFVHRDINRGNVWLNPRFGRVWIGDFGCCLNLQSNKDFPKDKNCFYVHKKSIDGFSYFTSQDCWRGGDFGISPEVVDFDVDNDTYLNYDKFDLYSIGVLGRRIVRDLGVELNEDLRNLINRLLERNPDDRIGHDESVNTARLIREKLIVDFEEGNRNRAVNPKNEELVRMSEGWMRKYEVYWENKTSNQEDEKKNNKLEEERMIDELEEKKKQDERRNNRRRKKKKKKKKQVQTLSFN